MISSSGKFETSQKNNRLTPIISQKLETFVCSSSGSVHSVFRSTTGPNGSAKRGSPLSKRSLSMLQACAIWAMDETLAHNRQTTRARGSRWHNTQCLAVMIGACGASWHKLCEWDRVHTQRISIGCSCRVSPCLRECRRSGASRANSGWDLVC
jgi:hypothetical protein